MEWNEYNCGYGEYGMFGDEAHAAGAAYEAITEPSHTFTAFHLHSDVQHWGIRASAHFSRMVATGACADALLTPVQRTLSIVTDAVHTAVAAREATSIEVYVVGIGAATALIIRDNGIPFTMSRLQTQLSAGYLTAAHDVVIEWGDTIIGVTKGLPPPSPSSDGAPRVTQGLRHISDDDATDDMTTEQFVMLGEGACVEAIVLFVTSWLAESHHPVNLGVGTTMFDVVDDTRKSPRASHLHSHSCCLSLYCTCTLHMPLFASVCSLLDCKRNHPRAFTPRTRCALGAALPHV